MKNEKNKILFLFIGAFVLMIISAVVLLMTYKDSKEEKVAPDERVENIDLTGFENTESVENVIKFNLDNKGGHRGCKLLSKYSEDYVSVMQWMLNTVCDEMNENGFTIVDYNQVGDDIEDVEEIEINGLEAYGSAENYITEYLNNNPDCDISDLLLAYCPDEYYALKNTYILGKEEFSEYNQASSQSLYPTLMEKYCEGDYAYVISRIDEILESYKLTMPYNYPLCNLYLDAKASLGYDNQEGTSAYIYGLDYMHSAETYLCNFLKLSHSEKVNYVLDDTSVLPFAYTHGIITSVKDAEAYDRNIVNNKYPNKINDFSEIKKISFYIGDTQNKNDTYEVLMICNYRTNEYYVVSLVSTGEKTLYKTAYEIRGTIATVSDENGDATQETTANPYHKVLTDDELNEVPEFIAEQLPDEEDSDYDEDYNYDYDYDYDYDDDNPDEDLDNYNDGDTYISEEYID